MVFERIVWKVFVKPTYCFSCMNVTAAPIVKNQFFFYLFHAVKRIQFFPRRAVFLDSLDFVIEIRVMVEYLPGRRALIKYFQVIIIFCMLTRPYVFRHPEPAGNLL